MLNQPMSLDEIATESKSISHPGTVLVYMLIIFTDSFLQFSAFPWEITTPESTDFSVQDP